MLTIVIIIAVISVILAVTLGLVFGLRKSGNDDKSCTLKVSFNNGIPTEYKDSCNSSLNSNNLPKTGELYCKLSEKDNSIIINQISKGGNADLKFTGVCSKFHGPGVKPAPPPPPPKSCNIDLSYNTKNPKFLEQIKIQDSCSPKVKTAADYINNKTDFCYPSAQNASALNNFINSFQDGINNTYSTTFNGNCKPYPDVFNTLSPQPSPQPSPTAPGFSCQKTDGQFGTYNSCKIDSSSSKTKAQCMEKCIPYVVGGDKKLGTLCKSNKDCESDTFDNFCNSKTGRCELSPCSSTMKNKCYDFTDEKSCNNGYRSNGITDFIPSDCSETYPCYSATGKLNCSWSPGNKSTGAAAGCVDSKHQTTQYCAEKIIIN